MRDDVARAAALRALEIAREAKAMKSEKGDKGDPGEVRVLNVPVPGEQGPMGPSGPRGPMGPSGPRGFQGERGDPGPQGQEGKQGATGPAGASGKDGAAGPKGERGPKGDKGDKGDQGPMPKFERKGLMIRFEKAPGEWGDWIVIPTGGGGGRDDKLTDRQKELVEIANLIRTQGDNTNKFIKTVDGVLQWDTLDGSDINLSSPPVIGNTTPNSATFTTLTANTSGVFGSSTSSVTPLAVNSGAGANNTRGITFNIGGGNFPYARIAVPSGSGGALGFFASDSGYEPVEQFRVTRTASAVNYVQVTGAATTGAPVLSAQGSDSNVSLSFTQKGSGNLNLQTSSVTRARVNGSDGSTDLGIASAGGISFKAAATANQVNYLQVAGSVANQEPILSAQGSDTNISMVFQSKGTGGIDLAAGSSGVNISNGGTVTAITRTAAGVYTSIPAATISAPTTAGGVQATGDVAVEPSTFTIVSGGSGYAVNDIVEISGGTFYTQRTRLTVSSVSAGAITGVTISTYGRYTVLPSSPNAVTTITGTGSGATITIVNSTVFSVNITNAGSGYVEQPTVTFSGGGGSGAAAYASVGSATTIRSLAGAGAASQSMSFATASGEAFRIATATTNATSANVFQVASGASGNGPWLTSQGSDTNIWMTFATKGTGNIQLTTNGGTEQLRVAHTASAVNYVQVTGGATGSGPTIAAQGSDTNADLRLSTKGTGWYSFFANNSGFQVFQIQTVASGANWLRVSNSAAGFTPSMSSTGSDTNIGLNLTTKGTGSLSLNTGGGEQVRIVDTATADSYLQLRGGSSLDRTGISVGGQNRQLLLSSGSGQPIRFYTGGEATTEQFRVSHTASAVNYVQVTGAATGLRPTISAQGSDSSIALDIQAKGTSGYVNIDSFRANYLRVQGSSTNGGITTLSTHGTDTNIDLALTPKGTGLVRFGTYTAGAPTATGYISIKAADGTTYKVLVGT